MAKRKSPIRSRASKSAKSKPRRTSKTTTRAAAPKRTSRASRALAPRKSKSHLKGWETRRANAAERSARVRKGWETRRANKAAKPKAKAKRKSLTEKLSAGAQRPNVEHQASVRYTKQHGASTGHSGTLQGSVYAPRGTPASELRQALLDHLHGKTPKFDVSAVEWRSRVR
jgi:hypothetical protein